MRRSQKEGETFLMCLWILTVFSPSLKSNARWLWSLKHSPARTICFFLSDGLKVMGRNVMGVTAENLSVFIIPYFSFLCLFSCAGPGHHFGVAAVCHSSPQAHHLGLCPPPHQCFSEVLPVFIIIFFPGAKSRAGSTSRGLSMCQWKSS